MTLSLRHIAALTGFAAGAMLLAAWGFQYIGGLAPCPMCIWQRWPHAVAGLLGVGVLIGGPLILWALAGAATMGVSTGLAIFHSGVERDWWDGPSTCTTGDIGGLSTEDLLAQIMSAPLVRCDEIPWSLFGLSMANWNALVSIGLVAVWMYVAMAARLSPRTA